MELDAGVEAETEAEQINEQEVQIGYDEPTDYKQTLGRRASVEGNRMKDFESSREPMSAKTEKEV
mgnify:CR=1 FL=1